ncbi:ABC transporter substrate binding protein [Desulfovibrio ferrophilus]|uniref:histidine kinase n=1 Tax=Desulfovibrio ferrophilus TaxID=241368 RepID=A0A2Z6AWP0_9BACT|nr:ABC transporter substrate binding protein [Desulfovibrio ferrophilus]BBD07641.1 signal transduction histidine kinase, nitrogen specific, NtrB [Desulfovibrio ferrophilus]
MLLSRQQAITLHHEYMDTKRIFTPSYQKLLSDYLSLKFKHMRYDLVIASDNNAFDFIRAKRDELFPNTPVVFCGINYLRSEDLDGFPLYTGIREDADLEGSIKLIRKIHPNVRRIVMITDRTTTGQLMRAEAERVTANRYPDMDFVIWDSLNIRELLSAIKELKKGDILLLTLFFRDSTGQFFEYDEAPRLISAVSSVPVYGTWDFTLGHGIVGGNMTTSKAQGKTAAQLALRILSGEPMENMPVVTTPPAIPMFDFEIMSRFKIKTSDLPEGSVVINRPVSIYEQHKARIIGLAILLIFMMGIIIALLIAVSRGKRIQGELEKSEAGLRQIIDTIPHAISARDAEGRFLLVNKAVAKRLGTTVDELTGKLLMDIHPVPAQAQKTLESDRLVITKGQSLFIPEEARKLKDRTIWTQTTKLPYVASRTGEHAVLCVSMDITDRKLAEDYLQHSQRFIQDLIDSQPSLVVGVDPACKVLHWNRQAEMETGIAADKAQGMDLFDVLPILNISREDITKAIVEQKNYQGSKIPFQSDKQIRYEDITVSPLLTDGRGGAVIRIDDVTERVRIEEIMIQTEKMMTVGGMAAGMAHELNNPLGAILQGIQNVERRISPQLQANLKAAAENNITLEGISAYLKARRIDQMLEGIRESAIRASTIIRNMLDFSRKSESQLAPMDINALIDTVLNLAASDYDLKKLYDFKKIEIVKDYSKNLPQVPVTTTEVEQVLLNLLKNAAQAIAGWTDMPHLPCITLRTREERDFVRIEVQDNGPGLDPEVRKRVFEPFFTTKAPGVGTGLGLSVSYFIITQNHMGTFTVRSRPGQGAIFFIRLPKDRPSS